MDLSDSPAHLIPKKAQKGYYRHWAYLYKKSWSHDAQ